MFSKQFTFNTAAAMVSLVIQFSLSFFLTSYLVEAAGSTAYGFFSMANTIVNYALIITNALNSMSARFVGLHVHTGDHEAASRFFSSVFTADLSFSLLILLPSTIAIANLEQLINIPSDLIADVKVLFFIVFLNMCCNVVSSVFGCVYTIKNRLDLSSGVQIISNIVKALLLIVLYSFFRPSIVSLGIAAMTASVIVALGSILYSRKLLPEVTLSFRLAKLSVIKEVALSGIWNSFNQLSVTLLNGLDLLITNLLVNAHAMGVLSLAGTLPGVISTCISSLANLFTPKFLEFYSRGETENLIFEMKNSIKFMTFISCLPISFLIAFGIPFYQLWTPTADIDLLYRLSLLVMLPQFSGGCINSLNYFYTVANKVKWQAVVLFISGCSNVILVFLLLHTTSLGVYAVAGVSAVIGFIRNYCFNAPYAAHCIGQPFYLFWPDMFKSLLSLCLCVGIGTVINHLFLLDTWLKLILVGGASTLLSGAVMFVLLLSGDQRQRLLSTFKSTKPEE